MTLASLPTPPTNMLEVGHVHLSVYALFILAGIVTAAIWAERRWRARDGTPGAVWDVTTWAVLAGIVGGRLYHVLSSPDAYFGAAGSPVRALYVWQGGLSVWGAVIGGAVGAWLICRRRGYSFPLMADAAAPAVALAQAIGRWGCYFNQELYGRPSTLPWAVRIDPAHRPADSPGVATYQPTFLYESLWDLAVAGVVVWADRGSRGLVAARCGATTYLTTSVMSSVVL